MSSYLTDEEIAWLNGPEVKNSGPMLICNVTQTQFSIARHYGGIKFNGSQFTYLPPTDELIRDDILKLVMKRRKAAEKEAAKDRKLASPPQPTLFEERESQ